MFNVLISLAKDGTSNGTSLVSQGTSNRDTLIMTVYKQYRTRQRILEPYRRLKNALKHLQEEYYESKENNLFMRYARLQHMIREVIMLEKQYWQLIEIPQMEVHETPNAYVQRIMILLDEKGSQPVKSGGIASLLSATMNITDKTKDQGLYDTIRSKSTDELKKECDRLYTELYKLIRKYLGLKEEVKKLADSYSDSRFYPIMPRYPLLKTMIKRVLRAPAFAEICHEVNE
uniref:Uncharacterized protein n=2 Tax=Acrobeloides nanus TaxID=290746 RepID=A0A914BYX3_9BILA